MPRIFGVTIPDDKKILYSLPYLYGIGLTTSGIILKSAGIDPTKNAKELTAEELGKIQKIIERSYKIEGDLRKEVASNQKHHRELGTWKGSRLSRHLPVHGRSKTNSRTNRGKDASGRNIRKTMGSGRVKAEGKK